MTEHSEKATNQKEKSADGNEEPPNKRRRIALACSACRTRKSRCDGARPKCTLCKDLGFECEYVQSASSSNVIIGKSYLSTLEDRVQSIEDTLGGFKRSMNDLTKHLSGRENHVLQQSPDAETDLASDIGNVIQEDTGDEVFAMGEIALATEKETGFFGASSNIAFLRHISKAVTQVKNIGQPWTPPSDSDSIDGRVMHCSRPSSPQRESSELDGINIYALPPDNEIKALVGRFFSDPGFLYPYINKEKFLQEYESMKRQPNKSVSKTWLGLMNIIMALATATTPSTKDSDESQKRMKNSERFFKRAMGLCQRAIIRGTSLEIVQLLLWTSMYLQGTQKSTEAWNIHGLAVKTAMQLGLHSSDAAKSFGSEEREFRKRVWFGCVLLDRTLSMTFGRPAAIPDSYVRLELPEPLPSALNVPSHAAGNTTSSIVFLALTVNLYRFIWKTIEALYGANLGCPTTMTLSDIGTSILRIDAEMTAWERDLPPTLRLRSSQAVALDMQKPPMGCVLTCDERLALLLTLRYHNIRLLLFRPILARLLDFCGSPSLDANDASVLQQMGPMSMEHNLISAGEIINIVHSAVHSAGKKAELGAWWFSLYYTFNAALVVFACLLVCRPENTSAPPIAEPLYISSKDALRRAIEALSMLDKGNVSVERCCNYLRALLSVLNNLSSSPSSMPLDLTPNTTMPLSFPDMTTYDALAGMDPTHFGMDFGEFMMPTDVDWLGMQFGSNGANFSTTSPETSGQNAWSAVVGNNTILSGPR